MVIKKSSLTTQLPIEVRIAINNAEIQIDGKVKACHYKVNPFIEVNFDQILPQGAIDILTLKYTEAGWSIEFATSQYKKPHTYCRLS